MLDTKVHRNLHQLTKEELIVEVMRLREQTQMTRMQYESREQEIAQKNVRLSSLLENTHGYIYAADQDMKLTVINTALRDLIIKRYGLELHQGADLEAAFSQNSLARMIPSMRRALNGENFSEVEDIVYEGKRFVYECHYNPIFNLKEEVTGFWLVARDITAQYQQTEKVKKNEQLLASINYSIREGIFRTTSKEGIVYLNKHFVEMFGYDSEEELYPIDPGDLYVDPSRRDYFRDYMQDHQVFNNEAAEFKRKDGSTFWGLVSSIKVTDEKGNTYYDGAIRDITQIREAHLALEEQNEELVKVNRELDKLVYSTSHDLRAPLVSILGLISIARIESDPEQRNRYFDLMIKSLNKLDDFIKDIMGYSRNSRAEIRKEEIDFEQLINEAFNSLRYAERYENIRKNIHIEGEGQFLSDPTRLQIIFNNLISNACRYHDTEKEDPYVDIHVTLGESGTQVAVKDNGIGIEPRYMGKIFEMFYRATNNSDGSGIGLYIVREAVSKLGGIINVQSTYGEGTTFHMEFPAMVEEAASVKA